MKSFIKTAYCFYIVQLLFKCKHKLELNTILDRLIDEGQNSDLIQGDNDIKEVLEYTLTHRRYVRKLTNEKPNINNDVLYKVFAKSLF